MFWTEDVEMGNLKWGPTRIEACYTIDLGDLALPGCSELEAGEMVRNLAVADYALVVLGQQLQIWVWLARLVAAEAVGQRSNAISHLALIHLYVQSLTLQLTAN